MSDDDKQRDDVEGEPFSPASPVVYVVQTDYDRIAVQRNHAVSRTNGIINTMINFQADRLALETRRDMLKECYKAYNLAQSTLEQWNPDESTSREEVEVYYVNGLTTFEKAIAAKPREETMGSTVNKDGVRLPAIDLPVFSGHGENWLEWFDKFNTLIHRRASLAVVQKFEYLKLSLRGAALGLIDSLPTTEGNYSIAYEMIERRYNNPKLLVQNHTRELFELKPVEVESAAALRNLFDSARKHLRCLENLKQPVMSWDAMLIYLMANKLDSTTRREWESVASGTTPPLYKQLENFVSERCQVLDAMPLKRKSSADSNNTTHKKFKTEVKAFTITKTPTSQRCSCCGAYHFVGSCNQYRAKSVEEKIRIIKKASLCYNCLRSGHNAEQCRSRNCMKCDRKHHTSIHRERQAPATTEYEHPRVGKQFHGKSNQLSYTILPTASVLVVANSGVLIASRVLLDSGSQCNFATKSFIRRVGITTKQVNCQVAGFGNFLQPIHEGATVSFKSRTSNYRKSVSVLVTDSITGLLPPNDVNVDEWNIAEVNLADPEFHLSRPVDMLLGTPVLFDILRSGNTK
nr:uncharacterized protein LOC115257060 [Aedes albopictus]